MHLASQLLHWDRAIMIQPGDWESLMNVLKDCQQINHFCVQIDWFLLANEAIIIDIHFTHHPWYLQLSHWLPRLQKKNIFFPALMMIPYHCHSNQNFAKYVQNFKFIHVVNHHMMDLTDKFDFQCLKSDLSSPIGEERGKNYRNESIVNYKAKVKLSSLSWNYHIVIEY